LVHNGIIENYIQLKDKLINKNIKFNSQTDTEVIVNLISYYYSEVKDIEKAIQLSVSKLEGTWGLVIMCIDTPDKLYAVRHGSPLLIGFGDGFMMVASEQSGFCRFVQNYICLKDSDIIVITKDNTNLDSNMEVKEINIVETELTYDPYSCWTEKEIYEQQDSSLRALGMGGRILDNEHVKLGGLTGYSDVLCGITNLILLGCGTSYYAGMYCLNVFKRLCNFNTVQLYDASEFTEYDIPQNHNKVALVMLSQSGETRDLYKIVELAKEKGIMMIGIVNVVDSLIAREVTCGIYLNAGREVAVASTKCFSSQVIVLNLLALFFSQIQNINRFKRSNIIMELRTLPTNIKGLLHMDHKYINQVASYLVDKSSVFILGKGNGESAAKEGALKLKEIGYIHAEGYSSSSLKHGPFALIEEGTPIIIISPTDEHNSKNRSVIEEVKSRGAYVILIGDKKLDKCDIFIKVPNNTLYTNLLAVIVLQFIAFKLSVLKNNNSDYPRNLAKTCVTD